MASPNPPLTQSLNAHRVWITVVLVLAVILVFGSATHFEFLVWDDDIQVTANPLLEPPWFSNVARFWKSPYKGLYIPVSYTFFAAEAYLSREWISPDSSLRPSIFHLGNVLLHVANVLLVWSILTRLTRNSPAAAVGAALFALHPLQVESVAWISEARGLLAALFSLLAISHYLQFRGVGDQVALETGAQSQPRKALHYGFATLCFTAALLCKPSAVVVPLMLLVIDLMMLACSIRRTALALTPWFLIAAASSLLTKQLQPNESLVYVPEWPGRFLVACEALGFYLAKLLAPWNLGVYCRPPQWVLSWRWTYFAWLGPAAFFTWLAWVGVREFRAAGLLFVAGILPVLGLVPFQFQQYSTVADRYVYLAMFGPALALTGALARWTNRPAWFAVLAGVAMCGMLSHGQLESWRNSASLFKQALAVSDENFLAHYMSGCLLADEHRGGEAIEHFERAVKLNPEYAVAYNHLGNALSERGELTEAIEAYRKCLELRPGYVVAHNGLANALARTGQTKAAIGEYLTAIKLDPKYARAHFNLAGVLAMQRQFESSITHYQMAIALDPDNADAHNSLAVVLARIGKREDAVAELRTAVRLQPTNVRARKNLEALLRARPGGMP